MNNDQLIAALQTHKSDTQVVIRYEMAGSLMRVNIEDVFLDGNTIVLDAGEPEED